MSFDFERLAPDEPYVARSPVPAIVLATIEKLTAERDQARADVEGLQGGRHRYLIAARSEKGTWGAFCEACSSTTGDYVWPCRAYAAEAPPPVLADVAERDQARRRAVALEQELAEPLELIEQERHCPECGALVNPEAVQ